MLEKRVIINKNANKKEITISRVIKINKIKINKRTIILIVKKLIRNIKNFQKEIEIAIKNIAIIAQITTIRYVNLLSKFTRYANIIRRILFAIILIILIINNNIKTTIINIKIIDRILS